MNDKYLAEKGKELAALVISANQVCDRSKMEDIELERLDKLVELARSMCVDTGEYCQEDDDKSFS